MHKHPLPNHHNSLDILGIMYIEQLTDRKEKS